MNSPMISACNQYLSERTGRYDWRAFRYRAACDWMTLHGLDSTMTITDVAAGWTEFDYCLRTEYDFRGRYIPVDGCIDGIDLEHWQPPRTCEYFVGLEIIEHLHNWRQLVERLQSKATRGIVLSTPNPLTVDVLAIDPTHVVAISRSDLEELGFTVEEKTFYGGAYSNGHPDALLATWQPAGEWTPAATLAA